MFIGLLVSQAIILNDSGPVPRDLVTAGEIAGDVAVLRHYELSGPFLMSSKLKEEVRKDVLPQGFGGGCIPSPHGDGFFARGSDYKTSTRGILVIWRINPLVRIVAKELSSSLRSQWLYGRDSVAVVEKTNRGPVGWVIDAKTGRTAGPMRNVLAFTDKPGSSRMMRVRWAGNRAGAKNFMDDRSEETFDTAVAKGQIVFEESTDLKRWRRVLPLAAAKRWIWEKSETEGDLHWLIFDKITGHRDSWLWDTAKTYEKSGQPIPHWVEQDNLFSNMKMTAYHQRPIWAYKDTAMVVSLTGDVTLSAPSNSDKEFDKWSDYDRIRILSKYDQMALRYGARGSRKWLIPSLPASREEVVLWK